MSMLTCHFMDDDADLQNLEQNEWFDAAIHNDLKYLKSLGNQYFKTVDFKHQTALMKALLEGSSIETIEYLVPHEAGYMSPLGESAIFIAIFKQNLTAVKMLAQYEHQLVNIEGDKPLWVAVKNGWVSGVEILAPYYPTPESVIDLLSGETPLIYAIQQVGTCNLMPSNSMRSSSPIDSAMFDNPEKSTYIQIIRALAPSQAAWPDAQGRSPVVYAVQCRSKRAADIIFKQIQHKQHAFISYIPHMTDLSDIDYFVEYFGQIDEQKRTALMYLAQRKDLNYINDVGLSIEVGSCIRRVIIRESCRQDIWGRSALMYAAKANNAWLAKFLIEKEQKLQDIDGYSALMHAALCNSVQCIPILKKYELNLINKQNNTALKLAVLQGFHEIIKMLNDEQVNIPNSAVNLATKIQDKKALLSLEPQFKIVDDAQLSNAFELSSRRDVLEVLRASARSSARLSALSEVKSRHADWDI